MKKKFAFGWGIVILLFIVAMVFLNVSTFTVRERDYALVTRFGKISMTIDQPGFYFMTPFVENVQFVYAGNRIYDIPTSDVITKDKKSMIADDYVIWQVMDPVKYYQTLGAVAARAEERIDAAVYNATKNTISSMSQDDIIAARGQQLTDIITAESNSDMEGYGIKIVTAEIKALDLPDDNKSAVYERMISERQNIAAGYTAQGDAQAQKIKNETDREVAITLAEANKKAEQIIAEGEAEYMKTLAAAYNNEEKADFYNFLRSLDSLKNSMKGSNKTIILDKDSELARVLYGK